jgi:hypothetical protein
MKVAKRNIAAMFMTGMTGGMAAARHKAPPKPSLLGPNVSVPCDATMPGAYFVGGPEMTIRETVYSTASKTKDQIYAIVVGKIENLSAKHPDYEYESTVYDKDDIGGMICTFKFKKK